MSKLQWYSIEKGLSKGCAFNLFIGGRGIGKTYSAIAHILNADINKFMYIRRSGQEMLKAATDIGNPFKAYNKDHNRNVKFDYSDNTGIGTVKEDDNILGYCCALSKMSSTRGADFSDVDIMLYDEFIPELHKSHMRGEGIAVLNMYESVNRNRELEGRPPVILIMLSNSVELCNDVLTEFGVIRTIEHMIHTGQESYTDIDRSLHIEVTKNTPISDAKSNTVLYRLTKGTNFFDSNINNKFINDNFSGIGKQNIQEYIPVVQYDDIYIYRHKSLDRFYATRDTRADCPMRYDASQVSKFRIQYGFILKNAVLLHKMMYNSMDTKAKVIDVLKLK